jgi:hypothetical protein
MSTPITPTPPAPATPTPPFTEEQLALLKQLVGLTQHQTAALEILAKKERDKELADKAQREMAADFKKNSRVGVMTEEELAEAMGWPAPQEGEIVNAKCVACKGSHPSGPYSPWCTAQRGRAMPLPPRVPGTGS